MVVEALRDRELPWPGHCWRLRAAWVGCALCSLLLAPHLSWDAGEFGDHKQSHPFADMTFIHEGNHTLVENLINFEKMVSSGKVGSHLHCGLVL